MDEDGRTRPLQEIPAGWRWVHQSGAGLVVANQPDQPMQPAASLIMNNRADQHASGGGVLVVNRVEPGGVCREEGGEGVYRDGREVVYRQKDVEYRQGELEGIMLRQDVHQQHYIISKQNQECVVNSDFSVSEPF